MTDIKPTADDRRYDRLPTNRAYGVYDLERQAKGLPYFHRVFSQRAMLKHIEEGRITEDKHRVVITKHEFNPA